MHDSGEQGPGEFVDSATDMVMSEICSLLHSSLRASCYNIDRPPYVHAQSLGYVSAATEYVGGYSNDPNNAEGDSKLVHDTHEPRLSTSIHPRYGGWFAYRILLVLNGIVFHGNLPRPTPLSFLSRDEKTSIIEEYNDQPELGYWRDFHNRDTGPLLRYDPVQFAYFHEKCINKRRRLIELVLQQRKFQA